MRKPFVAGNWKMNTDNHSSVNLAQSIASGASEIAEKSVSMAVFPQSERMPSIVGRTLAQMLLGRVHAHPHFGQPG